jgi:hypothetical protein
MIYGTGPFLMDLFPWLAANHSLSDREMKKTLD